ncbi:MAG TPA: hypothetical protein VEV16_09545, partial [Daejeonella sp.]|nr:hypothetical protein [Daejeonella sp.]
MKLFLFTLLAACLSGWFSKAQVHRFSLNLEGGISNSYVSTQNKSNLQGAFGAAFDYYFTDFLTTGIGAQSGKIITGSRESETFHYYSENQYKALNINMKMNLLKLTHKKPLWKFLGGVNLGTGVGFVKNDIQEISRLNSYNPQTKKYELTPVDLSGTYLSVPLMAGIDFKVNGQLDSPLLIGLNTQFNIIPNSHLDGYIQNNKQG